MRYTVQYALLFSIQPRGVQCLELSSRKACENSLREQRQSPSVLCHNLVRYCTPSFRYGVATLPYCTVFVGGNSRLRRHCGSHGGTGRLRRVTGRYRFLYCLYCRLPILLAVNSGTGYTAEQPIYSTAEQTLCVALVNFGMIQVPRVQAYSY